MSDFVMFVLEVLELLVDILWETPVRKFFRRKNNRGIDGE